MLFFCIFVKNSILSIKPVSMKNKYNFKKANIKSPNFSSIICLGLMIMVGFSSSVFGQENLIIRGGTINMSGNSSIKTNSLIIDNSGTLNIKSQSNTIVVNGDIINNSSSTKQINGTVIFEGSTNQTIGGSQETEFSSIEVNKTNSITEILLKQNILVNNKLNLKNGKIELSDFNINFLETGELLNENNTNFIKSDLGFGKIKAYRFINKGTNSNIAGLGIDIITTNFIGYKTIERFHQSRTNVTESINRFYKIPNFGEINKDNYISIKYLTSETNGLNESELTLINQNDKFEITSIKSTIDLYNKIVSTDLLTTSSISDKDENSIFTLSTLKTNTPPSINIKTEIGTNFKAYYSRSNQSIEIQFLADENGFSALELTNSLSKSVLRKDISTIEGENSYSLNVSELATGSYFLVYRNNKKQYSVKLIITK